VIYFICFLPGANPVPNSIGSGAFYLSLPCITTAAAGGCGGIARVPSLSASKTSCKEADSLERNGIVCCERTACSGNRLEVFRPIPDDID
jgi:hypothetical protein